MAFDISGETLSDLANGKLKLWTFTFSKAMDVQDTRKSWNNFLRNLRRAYPALCGLRVFELHEGCPVRDPDGCSHGLHVHVVTPQWWDVNRIRFFINNMRGNEWGRIHVKRVPGRTAYKYLMKYLKKRRPPCLKGWRLWASFGKWTKTRCCDLILDSFKARAWKYCNQKAGFKDLEWRERCIVARNFINWCYQMCHGVVWCGEIGGSVRIDWRGTQQEMDLEIDPKAHLAHIAGFQLLTTEFLNE